MACIPAYAVQERCRHWKGQGPGRVTSRWPGLRMLKSSSKAVFSEEAALAPPPLPRPLLHKSCAHANGEVRHGPSYVGTHNFGPTSAKHH